MALINIRMLRDPDIDPVIGGEMTILLPESAVMHTTCG